MIPPRTDAEREYIAAAEVLGAHIADDIEGISVDVLEAARTVLAHPEACSQNLHDIGRIGQMIDVKKNIAAQVRNMEGQL